MKGKIFIDNNSIINWVPEDKTGDVEGTKLAMQVTEQLLEEHGPMNILVDLSKAQRPNSLQRQIIINTIKSNQHNIKKIALFGESPLMKAVSFFVINTSGYGNIKFFMTRNQAIHWLQKEE